MAGMKDFVIENVSVPLLMFDYDDELQVINEPAKSILKVDKGIGLYEFAQGSDLRYILTKERRKAGKTQDANKPVYLQNQEDRHPVNRPVWL